jgi:hypothetical protein
MGRQDQPISSLTEMGGLHKGFFSIKEYRLLEITERVSSYPDEKMPITLQTEKYSIFDFIKYYKFRFT